MAVEAFARRLRESGLDAWFDVWEIQPGDDIVARMDAGVDGCDAALIFVSEAWFDGRCAHTWEPDCPGIISLSVRLPPIGCRKDRVLLV